MECKELKCDTRHCVSSRHVLSHYSRCKNHTCPVCGPVRDAIRKRLSKRGFSQVRSDDDGHPDEQPVQKRAKLTTPSVMASAFEEGASHADQTLRLQVKLKLLTHSAYCEDSINCKEKRKCTKMKVFFLVSFTLIPLLTVLSRLSQNYFLHLRDCPQPTSAGCSTCKKVHAIIAIHARSCRQEDCRVPKCTELKETNRSASSESLNQVHT